MIKDSFLLQASDKINYIPTWIAQKVHLAILYGCLKDDVYVYDLIIHSSE